MNPLATFGGGLSTSATSGVGPTSIGQSFAPSFFSPFAVGPNASASATSAPISDGATGTVSAPTGGGNLAMYLALGALAVAGLGLVLLVRK